VKILVTGGAGQLGRAMAQSAPGHTVVLLDRGAFDLTKAGAARELIEAQRPDVVVNAGAMTHVDRCETEVDLAYRSNALAVRWVADACRQVGSLLVQISTDYVFAGDGQTPYREWDATGPINVYGASKLAGEREALGAPEHLIVRTSWLYESWGVNFLNTMLKLGREGKALKVVDDQRGAPTTCRALARQLVRLIEARQRGLVNATCHGETTWFGFAETIFELAHLQVSLTPCTTAEYPRPARRPAYSVLSAATRVATGADVMPDWRAALAELMAAK
jgi:dTDP-4-dehydrorhamnose reductase